MSTQPLPTAAPQRRRWWLRPAVWAVALLAVLFGWGGWRVYDDHAAEGEARAAGFGWETGESLLAVIRADWHAAFRLATWTEHRRELALPDGSDLAPLRPLLRRLHPTVLRVYGCRNVDALRGLNGLRVLDLTGSDVQDLAPLAGLAQLKLLYLGGCTGVADLAPLAGLAQLQWLYLNGCTGLGAEAVAAFRQSHPQVSVSGP